jgi:hypothetical protein
LVVGISSLKLLLLEQKSSHRDPVFHSKHTVPGALCLLVVLKGPKKQTNKLANKVAIKCSFKYAAEFISKPGLGMS